MANADDRKIICVFVMRSGKGNHSTSIIVGNRCKSPQAPTILIYITTICCRQDTLVLVCGREGLRSICLAHP
jgi:hypothetical protein